MFIRSLDFYFTMFPDVELILVIDGSIAPELDNVITLYLARDHKRALQPACKCPSIHAYRIRHRVVYNFQEN